MFQHVLYHTLEGHYDFSAPHIKVAEAIMHVGIAKVTETPELCGRL
jgi:hypothetical protein